MVNLTIINQYSLLYKVKGIRDDGRLPYMLAAHLDVIKHDLFDYL